MAVSGSRDIFQYVDDQGRIWNAQLDVSEQLALGATRGRSIAAADAGRKLFVSRKQPITARYVVLQSTTEPARRLRKIICDPTSDIWTGATTTYTQDGEGFVVTSYHGESRYYVPSQDTAIVETTPGP